MRLDQLITHFDTSPAIRLLRATHAPFILHFLHRQFKAASRISIPASDLLAALAEYLEELRDTHPEALQDRAEAYLSGWSTGNTRWLKRTLESGKTEPSYELTPHTEAVFLYLDRVLQRDVGGLGTESRLRLVISTLADLVARGSRDPEVRLSHLREERKRLDDEIDRIEHDASAGARYTPTAIRERFLTAVTLLKELLGDFRAVEERFKEITRQVQKRHLDGKEARGTILEYALDSEDVLKNDDAGASFYEFFRFILLPEQQDRLRGIIAELGRIEEIAQQADGLATVRRMVRLLIDEAEKVMRTSQRLSSTLRRLLDTRTMSDRQRLAQTLADIRSLAVRLADIAPLHQVGITVEVGVEIGAPFERTFWSPPTEFAPVNIVVHEEDAKRRAELFARFAEKHRLDWRAMRGKVQTITRLRGGEVTLGVLVAEFPLAAGLIELLGYLQIAKDDGHVIVRDDVEHIVLRSGPGLGRVVTVPLVRFLEQANATS